jgi:hypothetical protein
MLFFTFLSRHKLAGWFILRSRWCLAPVVTNSFFCCAQALNLKAVRLLTNRRGHLYHARNAPPFAR